jgi:hypothetical protein
LGTGRLALSTDHVEAGRLVGGVTRIVTTAYRYKPATRKRKLALASPAVIIRANKRRDPEPANDDHPSKPAPAPAAAKPSIVTTTSRKRVKLLRAEERTAELDDPEADAAMRAWLTAPNAATGQPDGRRPRGDTGGARRHPRRHPARRPCTSPSARSPRGSYASPRGCRPGSYECQELAATLRRRTTVP